MMRTRLISKSLLSLLLLAALLINLTGCGSDKRVEESAPMAQGESVAPAVADELRQLQALKVHLDSVENRIEALKLDRQLLDERLNTLRAQQDENRRALAAIAERVPGGREAMGAAITPSAQPDIAAAASQPGGNDAPPTAPAPPARKEKERSFFGWVMVLLLLLILAAWIGAAVRRRKQGVPMDHVNPESVVVASGANYDGSDDNPPSAPSKDIPIYQPHASSSRSDDAPSSGPPLGTDVPDHVYGNEDSAAVDEEPATGDDSPKDTKE